MSGRPILKDSTDQSTAIRFLNSTTGLPEASVDHSTTGLALWYRREGGAKVTIPPVALAALTTAHTDGGVEPISDGLTRVDPQDGAWATGSSGVWVGGSATGMVAVPVYHPLVDLSLEGTTAQKLERASSTVVLGTVDTTAFTPTIIQFECDDITEATADHFLNKRAVFTSGALAGNGGVLVIDYSLQSGRGRFTVEPMTEAPSNNDTVCFL